MIENESFDGENRSIGRISDLVIYRLNRICLIIKTENRMRRTIEDAGVVLNEYAESAVYRLYLKE